MFRPRAVQRSASSNAITTTTTTTRTKILASADTDTDKAVSPTRNKTETGSKVERDSSTTVSDSILIPSLERERLLREKLLLQRALKAVQKSPVLIEEEKVSEPLAMELKEEVKSRFEPGDVLGTTSRYQVTSLLGEGVFATVYRCIDSMRPPSEEVDSSADVAVKVLRITPGAETLFNSELSVLLALSSPRKTSSHYLVRLLDNFRHEGHFCLVTENLHCNLRQAAKVIGRAGKIGLDRISSYTAQILDALRAVHELGYVHLDVKPDNVVVDKSYRVVKLIDFGSCLQERQLNDRRRTSNSYFVARFYRAPELMLRYGEWSSSIDVWSLGVTLLELAIGRVIFHGACNAEVLWNILCLLGPLSDKVLREAELTADFFVKEEEGYSFISKQVDTPTGKLRKLSSLPLKPKSLRASILGLLRVGKGSEKNSEYELSFADFVCKMLCFEPSRRLSCEQLMRETFTISP